MPFGYTLESDLGDYLHTFRIRAFPTYVCFVSGKEVERIEGVNFAGIQQMLSKHASSASSMPATGGYSLGGGTSSAAAAAQSAARRSPRRCRARPAASARARASGSASARPRRVAAA